MDIKIDKVNWLNIVHNSEFQAVLDTETIKEISLLSKLVREKFKPIVFENIALSAYNFNFIDDIKFKEFFIKLFKSGLFSFIPIETTNLRRNLSIEQGIINITCDLLGIKRYTKSFYLKDMRRTGFYLFPIVYNFSNLSALKLKSCSIPFSQISNIGNKLPNLRNIMLECVYFVKSQSDSISKNELILPANLHYLEIYFCKVINIDELSDPYEFIYTKEFSQATRNEFKLPKSLVPSLKKLTFNYNSFDDCGLEDFLILNPSLKVLTIEYFYSSLISILNSITSLEFRYLVELNVTTSYPSTSSITNLRINAANENYYEDIKKLCLLLPNLEYLYINLSYEYNFQIAIDRFITPILSNLSKLKTLELVNSYNWNINFNLINEDETQDNLINLKRIDLAKLPNIDTLILDCDSETIYNLNFKNCKTLKQVKLLSIDEVKITELKVKFDNFKNWKFNYSKHIIRGYNTII